MMDRVPYASLVGSLIFALVCTRPDIAYSVGVLSRFMANPGKAQWEVSAEGLPSLFERHKWLFNI